MNTFTRISILALTCVATSMAFAGPFTKGNIVVSRVGDGSAALTNAATALFLDEYTPAGVLVQSIALPTAVNGNNRACTDSGTATSDGMLQLSGDKKSLTVAGYDAVPGTAGVTGTASATVNRVIGWVKADGTVDTTTNLSTEYSANNFRSAVTVDGTGFWTGGTGTNGGVRYIPYGPGQTSTQISSTVTNTRVVNIFNGQLYVGTQSGAFRGVNTVGTGLPTGTGETITLLTGFDPSTTSVQDTYQYQFVDANTLYIAANMSPLATIPGGLQKWTFDGTTWTKAYTISAGLPGTNGCLGVLVVPGTGGNQVYVTNSSNTASTMFQVFDSGTGLDTFSPFVVAPANTWFRGLSAAPEAALLPVTLAPTSLAASGQLGTITAGDVNSLAADDANFLKLCKGFVPSLSSPKIRISANFTSPYLTPTAVTLTAKARMSTVGVFQIRGFVADMTNVATPVYGAPNQVIPNGTAINTTYATYNGNSTNVAVNVGAGGAMQARLEIQQTGFSAVTVPCSEFELLNLTVNP